MKILHFNVKEDDLECIMGTRSISLEFVALQNLRKLYQDFLDQFPTTLEQDMAVIRDESQREALSARKYFAIIYRTEMKRVLINQVKLVKICIHILERLMKGMTTEFALMRVFELESKQDVEINRRMIANYVTSLKKGFKRNRDQFLEMNNMTLEGLRQVQAEKKFVDFVGKAELKQFELTGQEKMLARILEAPMKSAKQNNNVELQKKLQLIRNQLFAQPAGNQHKARPQMPEAHASAPEKKSSEDTKPEKPRKVIDSVQEHIYRMRDELLERREEAKAAEAKVAESEPKKALTTLQAM